MSVTTTSGRDVVAAFDSMEKNIIAALPAHVPFTFFRRIVLTAVQASPDLLKADVRSLLTASLKLAATGLVPDGREAALVVFSGRVQTMPMVFGLMKLARQSGEVQGIRAQIVHEGEPFRIIVTDGWPAIEHEISPIAIDAGKPLLAYAVAVMKDGLKQSEWMTWNQIGKVRSVSRAKDSGPWVTWPEEMAKKTVIRRLCKSLPLDRDRDTDRRFIDAVEAVDDDHAPLPTPKPTGRLDQLEAQLDEVPNLTPDELRELAEEE